MGQTLDVFIEISLNTLKRRQLLFLRKGISRTWISGKDLWNRDKIDKKTKIKEKIKNSWAKSKLTR